MLVISKTKEFCLVPSIPTPACGSHRINGVKRTSY